MKHPYRIPLLFFMTIMGAILAALPYSAHAQYREGFYLGVTVPYTFPTGGDFDGNTVLANGVLITVPKLKGNYGWGIFVGRKTGNYAGEFAYIHSSAPSSAFDPRDNAKGPAEGTSPSHFFLLNGRVFHPFSYKLEGNVVVGLGYRTLTVRNGFYTAEYYNIGTDYNTIWVPRWSRESDAQLRGLVLNLEPALNYYPLPGLGLSLGGFLRVSIIGSAVAKLDGEKVDYELEEMELFEYGLRVSLMYFFMSR